MFSLRWLLIYVFSFVLSYHRIIWIIFYYATCWHKNWIFEHENKHEGAGVCLTLLRYSVYFFNRWRLHTSPARVDSESMTRVFPTRDLAMQVCSLALFLCSIAVLFIRFCVSLPVHDSRFPSRDLPTSCCSFACCAFHSCPIYQVLSSLLCRLAEDLMKDINSMLSDFSSELDSMFDWASTCILSTTWWKGLLRFPRYNHWEAD